MIKSGTRTTRTWCLTTRTSLSRLVISCRSEGRHPAAVALRGRWLDVDEGLVRCRLQRTLHHQTQMLHPDLQRHPMRSTVSHIGATLLGLGAGDVIDVVAAENLRPRPSLDPQGQCQSLELLGQGHGSRGQDQGI